MKKKLLLIFTLLSLVTTLCACNKISDNTEYKEKQTILQTIPDDFPDKNFNQFITNEPTDTIPYGSSGYIIVSDTHETNIPLYVFIYDFSQNINEIDNLYNKMKPNVNKADYGLIKKESNYLIIIMANKEYENIAKIIAKKLGYE